MAFTILEPAIQQFIRDNTGQPVAKMALQKNPFPHLPWPVLLEQIAAREKARLKLPTWFNAENIIYPSKISTEQTSSETAAGYKSGLVSGESLIDLTGGFGIDDYYFSQKMGHVVHCELDRELSAIAAHNFEILGRGNITCHAGDSAAILQAQYRKWDWIYADPARRSDAKGKVFMLADCLPDVPRLLSTYFKYTDNILIKTAPILDITAGMAELDFVKAVHIVAINNEVKELLWVLEEGFSGIADIVASAITKQGLQTFKAPFAPCAEPAYSLPQKYLYEPNSAIMKSGAFDAVAHQYSLAKLHKHTQLYTSDAIIDFPGRRFVIKDIVPYLKTGVKAAVQGKKMNITVRNFPLSVESIRKKWKISEGGDNYCFFTTNIKNEKIVVLCAKI